MATDFKSRELYDALEDFDGGVNENRSPLKLPRNVMARATNVTVRGDFATHRPPVKKVATLPASTIQGKYQGGCYYKPDNAGGSLCFSLAGNFVKFYFNAGVPTFNLFFGTSQDANADQHWMWQSEKWVIWNDGINSPVFFNNTLVFRDAVVPPASFSTTNTADFLIPAVGASVVAVFAAVASLNIGDVVSIKNQGTMQVLDITGLNVTLLNIAATPEGFNVVSATVISWTHITRVLPPGRMGAYGMGRNWVCLPDGKQFIASDIVGGSSGSVAENYRDAVLKVTENLYLSGGGNFTVPGSIGSIQSMAFSATLDSSLGQGPLQVFTDTHVFSCNAPVERTKWQDINNPILTESLISNGAKGQNSTVLANGDIIFRSIDGIRSLILARREFDTWGNTPISIEVDPILRADDPGLLRFGSAIVFDNRLLMTTHPVKVAFGVYHTGIIPLNFDPVSSLRGKLPSVYDAGIWTGLNVLQLIVGDFDGVERAFAIVLNTSNEIEIWEILKDGNHDETNTPIVWDFASASLKFGQDDPRQRDLLRLQDGEIYVDKLVGTVRFEAFYKPDQYPCWVSWFSWTECQTSDASDSKPGFRPRMGLGEPSGYPCDENVNRPLRECYTMQFRLVVRGHCRFLGARFKASTIPQPEFAPQQCATICEQT